LQVWLAFLIAYWAAFLGYTIFNFLHGGSTAVIAWYQHVSATGATTDGSTLGFPSWKPIRFAIGQIFVVALTGAVWIGLNKLRVSSPGA
jgi:hypothetical protein